MKRQKRTTSLFFPAITVIIKLEKSETLTGIVHEHKVSATHERQVKIVITTF